MAPLWWRWRDVGCCRTALVAGSEAKDARRRSQKRPARLVEGRGQDRSFREIRSKETDGGPRPRSEPQPRR